MKLTLKRYLAVIALSSPLGCVIYDGRAEDAGVVDDAGIVDAGTDPVDDCPDDVCVDGCAHPIVGLCLPARIDVDTAFSITTLTSDCLGSSCTIAQAPVCDVGVGRNSVVVTGSVCEAHDDNTDGCTDDCGGANGGACTVTALSAGTWTFIVGDDVREVTVPFVREPANTDDCFGAGF